MSEAGDCPRSFVALFLSLSCQLGESTVKSILEGIGTQTKGRYLFPSTSRAMAIELKI
jgi:hypothetical protein